MLHTYMDMLRFINKINNIKYNNSFNWRSEEDREINHHGRPVKVGEADVDDESIDGPNKVKKFWNYIVNKIKIVSPKRV